MSEGSSSFTSRSQRAFRVMKAILASSLVLAAAAPAGASGPVDDAWPDALRRTAPAVVQVRCGDYRGSGFLYSTASHVVTSFAVANHGGDLSVVASDGTVHRARVVAWSEADDLALLELSTPARAQPLRLSVAAPYAGQPIALLGYPSKTAPKEEDPPHLDVAIPRFGRVSVVYDRRVRIDTDAWTGDPGAPILASSGEVVGVVSNLPQEGSAVVPTARANQVELLVAQRGKQGTFDPHPPVESAGFAGLFVTPFASDGLVGAAIEAGYRHGWLAGSWAMGAFMSPPTLETTGVFERHERVSFELHGAAQVSILKGTRLWLGPGAIFVLDTIDRWTPDSSRGFTKSTTGPAAVHATAEFGFAAFPIFIRDVVDFAQPAVRLDVGVFWGR